MGTIYQEPPHPLLDDLKVTVQNSTLVFCPQESEPKSMFLSNIDQVLNFDVHTIHFFAANPEFPPQTVTQKIQNAIQKLLVPYEFLAGRMKLNPKSGRFEFDCNNAGVGFVVASSEYSLDEIGDLVYPNPAFQQLVTQRLDSDKLDPDTHPLCIFQVTSFKCGGLAMGIQTNHATFDGLSFKTFLENLAAVSGDKHLSILPCNDRQLLSARSPPLVTFPHPELLKLNTPLGLESESNPNVFEDSAHELDFKVFRLTPNDIFNLKARAKSDQTITSKVKITGFNVVSAHIWRCKALSNDAEDNAERSSTILYAVDIRPRLTPPLPKSFAGNAVLTAYATAKCKEIEEAPLWKLIEMVGEGAARMTDEYARSAIDWGELYKGFPNGEFLISSWWRLGFSDVKYPWGKPKYSCPLVYRRKDIILLFPDINEGEGSNNNDGVNVLVALPHKEMEKFQSLFYKYLP